MKTFFIILLCCIDLIQGINFTDWSLKFLAGKRKNLVHDKYYDAKWAFFVMHRNRHHKPDINISDFFKNVEANIFEDLMRNHVGPDSRLSDVAKEPWPEGHEDQIVGASSSVFPQISLCSLKKCKRRRRKRPTLPRPVARQLHVNHQPPTNIVEKDAVVDLYPYNGGYSVMGVDAESAVGLLGLLLFIDLMRDVMQTVAAGKKRRRRKRRHDAH